MPRRIMMAVAAAAITAAGSAGVAQAPIVVFHHRIDPRIPRLERFFRHYRCPEPYHVEDYLRASDGYQLDYRLLPAISIRESRCGVSEQMANNHWGYHPSRQSFPTVESGIDYVAHQLAEGDYYRGRTLQQKLFVYNPLPKYPAEIQSIMRQIEQ
jgi:hypothetical protein